MERPRALLTNPDLAGLIQIGAGAIVGAVLAVAVQRRCQTRYALVVATGSICAAAGVLAMIGLQWPHLPIWAAVGAVASAAPLSVAVVSDRTIDNAAEARIYLRRTAAAVTIHVLYAVASATVGFVASLSLVLLLGATI
jgi:predicted lysophospholipase L1 biosynthesis ABC-type transport system permease subunit